MKTILLICAVALTAFAQTQAQIIVQEGETRVLRGQRFENFTGDFVIKNFGFLIIENRIYVQGNREKVLTPSELRRRILAKICSWV